MIKEESDISVLSYNERKNSSCQVFLFAAQPADQLRHLASLLQRWTLFDLSKMRSIENDKYMDIKGTDFLAKVI